MARAAAAAARLEAVAAAKQLHRQLGLEQLTLGGSGTVEVFDAIAELGIPLVFKPIKSALGWCLPAPDRGIMVSTKRGLHVQRFTAAHELGHVVLGHEGNIAFEVLERGPSAPDHGRDLREVAAEAFAAEFLLPRWLYRHHVRSQGWTVERDLRAPATVYQLSLRLGASYTATCWGLLSHQVLGREDVDALLRATVKKLKAGLGEGHMPGSSWSDVWRLTGRDSGTRLTGNPDDLLRIELEESAAGGYQWQVGKLTDAGCTVLSDRSSFPRNPLLYGSPSMRTLIARPPPNGNASVRVREEQPWAGPAPSDPEFAFDLRLEGPERGGMSRASRRRLGIHP